MSDGPHRSLNMHRSWKRLAEYADNAAHSIDDLASAYFPALTQTCDREASANLFHDLVHIFGEQQQDFFKDETLKEVAALRLGVAGFPLANTILDAAEKSVSKGAFGMEALVGVVTEGLLSRAARANRQIEEHYYRMSNEARTKNIRDRMEKALNHAALDSLARQCLNMHGAAPPARPTKQSALDDGVQLK